MTGIEAFLEVLASAGVRYIFGNPGTTELPLNDALAKDDRFEYIFALQEVPLTAMADGYAMASGTLGVVCVHISCGLGNAMGMLYNAHVEGTPLLILAGQQDRRLLFSEPVLASDTVSVARPWTKWAHEVGRVEDVPQALRRAMQTALTPPTGPVFLSLPLDVQLETIEDPDTRPPSIPDRRIRPALSAVEEAVELLTQARQPAILAGSRVLEADACDELARFAETLGAPVFSEATTAHGRVPMQTRHPLYAGTMPLWSNLIHETLHKFDVVVVVGLNLFRLYIRREIDVPLPPHIKLIQIDNDPWEIGKNYPVEAALFADPKTSLDELTQRLCQRLSTDQQAEAKRRMGEYGSRRDEEQTELRKVIERDKVHRPMKSLVAMDALARALPNDAVLVEEAITSHHSLFEKFGVLEDPAGYIAHRGWALGWGMGCALGVQLAWPDRPVVGLIGDGSAMYGIQGLWSAAHHHIPVTFVIANNSQYKILKDCAKLLPLPQMAKGNNLAMDLTQPDVDFVALAEALGVEAYRCTEPDELSERLRNSLTRTEPMLLDVPMDR